MSQESSVRTARRPHTLTTRSTTDPWEEDSALHDCQRRAYRSSPLGSKFEVRSRAQGRRDTSGAGRPEQTFFDPVQAFPRGFRECRIGPDDIADHLPGSEIQRALRRRTHGQRDRALRTETNPLCRGFLARPHSHSLCEQIYGDRFLSGLELPIAAKTI